MKIFNKSYVGIRERDYDNTTMAPLAFLTPFEDNAAGATRRKTVRDWATQGLHYQRKEVNEDNFVVVDNEPTAGFRIIDFAERYSTSNKLARVFDPNGYELEISMANLIEIILTAKIDNGLIQEECVWGREGAQNWLLVAGTDKEQAALREGQVLVASIGDRVMGAGSQEYIYLGRGYVQNIAAVGEEFLEPYNPEIHNFYERQYGGRWSIPRPNKVATARNSKLMHVYLLLAESKRHGGDNMLVTQVKPMKLQGSYGPSDFEWDENTVFYGPHGMYYNAEGHFSAGRRINARSDYEDDHRYHTRDALFRDVPFGNDDLDTDILLARLVEKENA